MNTSLKCENCGAECRRIVKDSMVEIGCIKCTWKVASSYIPEIVRDRKKYNFQLTNMDPDNNNQIKVLAKLLNENYLATKRRIESGVTITIRKPAHEFLKDIPEMVEADIHIRFSSDFSWIKTMEQTQTEKRGLIPELEREYCYIWGPEKEIWYLSISKGSEIGLPINKITNTAFLIENEKDASYVSCRMVEEGMEIRRNV